MNETSIENKVVDYARKKGWDVYKFKAPGRRGVQDRIFFRNSRTFLIEFKKPGGKTSKLQRVVQRKFIRNGFDSYITDSVEEGKWMVDNETNDADS